MQKRACGSDACTSHAATECLRSRGADPRAVMTLTFETPRMRTVSDMLLYTKLQHIRSMRNIGDDAGITQSHTTATSRVDWALLRW